MSASFDTTRLDEECERIARLIQVDAGGVIRGFDVCNILMGKPPGPGWTHEVYRHIARKVFGLCRRPKMVSA
jgi:hypothetical protein